MSSVEIGSVNIRCESPPGWRFPSQYLLGQYCHVLGTIVYDVRYFLKFILDCLAFVEKFTH